MSRINWTDRALNPVPDAPDGAARYDLVDKTGRIVAVDVKMVLKNEVINTPTKHSAANMNQLAQFDDLKRGFNIVWPAIETSSQVLPANINLLEVIPSMSYYKLFSNESSSKAAMTDRQYVNYQSMVLDDGTVVTVGRPLNPINSVTVTWFLPDGTAKSAAATIGAASSYGAADNPAQFQLVKLPNTKNIAFAFYYYTKTGTSSGAAYYYVCFANYDASSITATSVSSSYSTTWPMMITTGTNGAVCFSKNRGGDGDNGENIKAWLLTAGGTSFTAIQGSDYLYGSYGIIFLAEDGLSLRYIYSTAIKSSPLNSTWTSAGTLGTSFPSVSSLACSGAFFYYRSSSTLYRCALTGGTVSSTALSGNGILSPAPGGDAYYISPSSRVRYNSSLTISNTEAVYTSGSSVYGYSVSLGTDFSVQTMVRNRIYTLPYSESPPERTLSWACPEDGLYKFILVGGGADGSSTYGGGSGYLTLAVKWIEKDTIFPVAIGQPGISGTATICGEWSAAGASGSVGGADGGKTATSGGAGGYDLTKYGGCGGSFMTVAAGTCVGNLRDINGGTSLNAGAATDGVGFGAGGASGSQGYPGCIVIFN